MRALVTGGSGFIAKNLVTELLKNGWDVISVDLLDTHVPDSDHRVFDVSDTEKLISVSEGCDTVFHMAANSDIRAGTENPNIDFSKTLMTTRSVLETMRINGIKKLFFPSTSAVYGNRGDEILNEKTGNLSPVSYYGGCKLASEALIHPYTRMNGFSSLIFRFPNVVGPGMTHGVIYDFIRKLRKNPEELEILGDGKQSKPYVHTDDLIDGILQFMDKLKPGVSLFNVSTGTPVTVDRIADIVCEEMGVSPVYRYTGGESGWKGDVPRYSYDTSEAEAAGWRFRYDSEEAVRRAARYELAHD
jgi:UDP-glucose 4-epimerase